MKNAVLAAIVAADALRASHEKAVAANAVSSDYAVPVSRQLHDLSSGLQQTLDAVLSQAMASEVVNGVYKARTVPCSVMDVLNSEVNHHADSATFPVRTRPEVLPPIDMDPGLLVYIYRNAISNAVKYGKKGGVVVTELEQARGRFTLRVINELGEGHEQLRDMDPGIVFHKGTRLHPPSTSTIVASKGDGAWIMQKCASCLQGRCHIDFQHDRTVFEFKCPAVERQDEAALLEPAQLSDVWAIAVDDCGFQRLVLEQILEQAGVLPSRTRLLGETMEEIEGLTEIIVQAVDALPPSDRILLVIDENLDLPSPGVTTISGSACILEARHRLGPVKEARVLALVRSANDSPTDQVIYNERAHGFLPKAPCEPEYKAILRAFSRRFSPRAAPHDARGRPRQTDAPPHAARPLLLAHPDAKLPPCSIQPAQFSQAPSAPIEAGTHTAAAAELKKVCTPTPPSPKRKPCSARSPPPIM